MGSDLFFIDNMFNHNCIPYFQNISSSIISGFFIFSLIKMLADEITSYFDKFKIISEAVNSADSKEKVLDNIYRSLGVANRAKIEKIRNSYKPIYEGNFSKSITENNEIYFPIYEILPLINSKVVIDDGTLYISPNRGSVFKALYNSNIGSLVFDADSDLGYGKTFMDITAYTCSTLFTGRIDRLDFITKSGKRNDYETVFSDYLTDDEVYLAAFDNASPLKDEVDIAKDLLGGAKTAFGLLDKLNVKNTKTDALKKFEKVLYSKNSEFVKNIGSVSDTLGAVKDLGDYFYTYLYQVEDHRKMLGAVYNYDFSASSIDKKTIRMIILLKLQLKIFKINTVNICQLRHYLMWLQI